MTFLEWLSDDDKEMFLAADTTGTLDDGFQGDEDILEIWNMLKGEFSEYSETLRPSEESEFMG